MKSFSTTISGTWAEAWQTPAILTARGGSGDDSGRGQEEGGGCSCSRPCRKKVCCHLSEQPSISWLQDVYTLYSWQEVDERLFVAYHSHCTEILSKRKHLDYKSVMTKYMLYSRLRLYEYQFSFRSHQFMMRTGKFRAEQLSGVVQGGKAEESQTQEGA